MTFEGDDRDVDDGLAAVVRVERGAGGRRIGGLP